MPDETLEPLVAEWDFDIDAEKSLPRLLAILFFDYANETSDRKVNLAGVFDRLFVDQETKKTVPIGVFVKTAETLDSPVYVSIISPEKKPVSGYAFKIERKEIEAELKGKEHLMTQILSRVQFDAPIEGTYWFNVAFNGRSLGGCPLKIEFRDFKDIELGQTRGDA